MQTVNKPYKPCPGCGQPLDDHPALSRFDNRTPICAKCGVVEAIAQANTGWELSAPGRYIVTEADDDETTPDLEALVTEDALLAEQAEEVENRRKQIRLILADHLPLGASQIAGRRVSITEPARLDTAALERDYSRRETTEILKAAIDRDELLKAAHKQWAYVHVNDICPGGIYCDSAHVEEAIDGVINHLLGEKQ